MKRLLAALIAIFMLLPACAMASGDAAASAKAGNADKTSAAPADGAALSTDAAARDKALISAAGELAQTMLGLNKLDGYFDAYGSTPEIKKVLDDTLKNDYSEPKRTIVLTINGSDFGELYKAFSGKAPSATDANIISALREKVYAAPLQVLNAQIGISWVSATSILASNNAIQLVEAPDTMAYVIFDYGDEMPMIYTAFNVNSDGLASTLTDFLQLEADKKAALFDKDGAISELASALSGVPDGLIAKMIY